MEPLLAANDIAFLRIDGKRSDPAREEAIRTFARDDSPPVILVSVEAGGAGVNLQTANGKPEPSPEPEPAS
eukprot:5788169-Prymnesium_polylepis.1